MIHYLVLSIVFITFLLACFEDIKKREVYDYLNFTFALFILITATFDSLVHTTWDPIKYSAFGMIIGFGIGAILFYTGIWGGGDAKFLLGFSASIYYLKQFITETYSDLQFIYDLALTKLNHFFGILLDIFLNYILILDLIFLTFIIIQFLLVKRKSEKTNLLILLTTLSLLTAGLHFNIQNFLLIGILFIVFIIIFFAREGAFDNVYYKYKKHLKYLQKGHKIDTDIIINQKTIISYDDGKFGLTKEHLHKLHENLTKKTELKDIYVRKTLPLGILVLLNFVIYLMKIINIDNTNLEILSYLIKYIFFSFMAGGVLAVFVVFYYFLKNFKEIKLNIPKYQWIILIITILTPITLQLITNKFLSLAIIPLLYIFIKMAISIESVAFTSYKPLNKIALGDWVVQDVYDKKKLIYEKTDFKIGIDEFQLEKIKKLSKTNPKLEKLKVKDGIAFLPALFIGFLILHWIYK